MKLTPDTIATTALNQLNELGINGLTMRAVAQALNVQVSALYWHVKNKRELLDVMATRVLLEVADHTEAPLREVTWQDWLFDWASRFRRAMCRYRDGGRVVLGSAITDPAVFRMFEVALRTMRDAGFDLREAARLANVLHHYTVGFTVEQQTREGHDYLTNPYAPQRMSEDLGRYPLLAEVRDELIHSGEDSHFEHGIRLIIAGANPGPRPTSQVVWMS